MRAVIQRVSHASVTIDGKVHGEIQKGFLILLGVEEHDGEAEADYLAEKCIGLRVFTDEHDKMNLSLREVDGAMLVISQFTLYGDCRKGKRPNFMRAARPETAIPLYERFLTKCKEAGLTVETGEFGADMAVELLNDGPVTILMDTEQMRGK